MTTQTHEPPKQRIDNAEIKLSILEKQVSVLRRDNQQLQQIAFAQSNRIAELEMHQTTLRNIMARMSQKMEGYTHDAVDTSHTTESAVCHMEQE